MDLIYRKKNEDEVVGEDSYTDDQNRKPKDENIEDAD
jgi:hypothetical protein